MTEPAGYVTRLYTECSAEAADDVASLFHHETRIAPVVELLPSAVNDPDEPLTFAQAAVSVYLEPGSAPESLQTALDVKLHLLAQLSTVGTLQRQTVRHEDWAESWKKHYTPVKVGSRLVICPSWQEYHPSANEIVLKLDPGMAFGTGVHPTTQMCLAELEIRVRPGDKVFDAGTGSGILTLGALGLGASSAVAVDVETVAVDTASANIERAGLSKKAKLILADIKKVRWSQLPTGFQPPYDLVMANLTAGIIVENLAGLLEPVKAGGTMIASGIIVQREQEVLVALADIGATVSERHEQNDWLCLVVNKP